MEHDRSDDEGEPAFDASETDPLGIEAQRIAAAHAAGKPHPAKLDVDDGALAIKDDQTEKPTRAGFNPYDTSPKPR